MGGSPRFELTATALGSAPCDRHPDRVTASTNLRLANPPLARAPAGPARVLAVVKSSVHRLGCVRQLSTDFRRATHLGPCCLMSRCPRSRVVASRENARHGQVLVRLCGQVVEDFP